MQGVLVKQHKTVISTISVATLELMSAQIWSGTMGPTTPIRDWLWVGSVSGGPVWESVNKTQTFYIDPEVERTYVARKSTDVLASGEIFLGLQKTLPHQWLGQLGLAAATTGDARLQGYIWDDADPQFNNYSYQYRVRHSHVAVKGKLLLDKGYWFLPWISGSLGVGFNRAHDYTNTPLIFEALPNANFTDHTKSAFSYTLGTGIQKPINEHWQIGTGYEFANWGKSELSRAPDQTLNSGLHLNHLYTSGVMLNLTYIA